MNEDIYRKVGSPEVDKAWEDLGSDCNYIHENFISRRDFNCLQTELALFHTKMVWLVG